MISGVWFWFIFTGVVGAFFTLGFFIGLTVGANKHTPKHIAVNEDEDVLFDRLEALRKTRFAPPMKPIEAPPLKRRFDAVPKVPEKIAALRVRSKRKDK